MPACPACQTENSPKSRFCRECGTALPAACPEIAEETETVDIAAGRPGESAATEQESTSRQTAPESIRPSTLTPGFVADTPERQPPAQEEPAEELQPVTTETAAPFAKPDWKEDEDPEIDLFINFRHVLVAGHASTLELRAVNPTPQPLENVRVTVESRGLDEPVTRHWRRLPPGQQSDHLMEIDPGRPGNFVLQVSVTLETGGQQVSYRGHRSLRINQPPDSSNIVINISDIQSNTGSGANAGLGADYGDVNISNLLGEGSIKTLNDLLNHELPENYFQIPLELDYELSVQAVALSAGARRRSLRIPSAWLGHAQPGTRCRLEPVDGRDPGLLLRAGPRFLIGRSRGEVDLVAWFWPRDAQKDERTRKISKIHVILESTSDGIRAWDAGSANGTCFDGQPLGGEDGIAKFDRRASLLLGNEYAIEVTHFQGEHRGGPAISNERSWPGPPATERHGDGCVRFEAVDTGFAFFEPLWLLTDASFGSSRSNPVARGDEGLAEIQGRLHFHRGCFWVENVVDNNAVKLNGAAVRPGEIAPLTSGVLLTMGQRDYRVAVE